MSEKFLLLHTSPRKPNNSNRWVYVHIGSFFNLGFNRIDSHLYFIKTLSVYCSFLWWNISHWDRWNTAMIALMLEHTSWMTYCSSHYLSECALQGIVHQISSHCREKFLFVREWVTKAQKRSLAVQVRDDMLHLWKVRNWLWIWVRRGQCTCWGCCWGAYSSESIIRYFYVTLATLCTLFLTFYKEPFKFTRWILDSIPFSLHIWNSFVFRLQCYIFMDSLHTCASLIVSCLLDAAFLLACLHHISMNFS